MDYPVSDGNARLVGGKFTDGDPVNAIPPSKNSATYQNAVHDELLNVIAGGGLTPDETQLNQVFLAVQAIATSITANAISDLVGGAPGALDTLNELAAALADDADYAATITAALATKSVIGHGHAIADVSGLQTALDGKSNAGHGHSITDIADLNTALSRNHQKGEGRYIGGGDHYVDIYYKAGNSGQRRFSCRVTYVSTGIYRFYFTEYLANLTTPAIAATNFSVQITLCPGSFTDQFIPYFTTVGTDYLELQIRTENDSLNDCEFYFSAGWII